MSNDYGMFGKALRAIGVHRERLGADTVMSQMNKGTKVKAGKSSRQKKIDDEIRRKRKKRQHERMEVEGGYIE